jgi:hypothetical protein
MLRLPFTLFAALLTAVFCGAPAAYAQRVESVTNAPVEVSAVRFRPAKADQQQNPWMEIEIDLQTKGRDAKQPGNPRFVDMVRIDLMIAFEVRESGEKRFTYFRSSATALSLEAGKSVARFYLPWEVLKRDGLSTTEPNFWMVALSAGDQELPASPRALSSKLESPQVLQSFRQRVAADGVANDGVLVPQHDSPFANTGLRDSPSFVRRPAR